MIMGVFSDEEILKLEKNKYVIRVTKKIITYTFEFKKHFIGEYLSGKLPQQIFEESGFDINIIGPVRIRGAANHWSAAYKKNGLIGLQDTRDINCGRPITRELTQKEIIERQEAKIKMLEAQVELLKNLEAKERMLIKEGRKLKSMDIFKIINEIVTKYNF